MRCVGAHRRTVLRPLLGMRIDVWTISLLPQLNESLPAERAGYALSRGVWEREKHLPALHPRDRLRQEAGFYISDALYQRVITDEGEK